MSRLPTVKLIHKRTGEKKIVNATDYQRDIAAYNDWKIYSQRRGDAPYAEIKMAASESNIDKHRKQDAEREKRFGDNQRAQDYRSSKQNIVTESDQVDLEESIDAVEQKEIPEIMDWTKMGWHEACRYIQDLTGVYPRGKVQAGKLMDEYIAKLGS